MDLTIACNFAAIDWAKKDAERGMTNQPADWADRVTRAYDQQLAETCMRVIDLHADLPPAEAARTYLRLVKGWKQEKGAVA